MEYLINHKNKNAKIVLVCISVLLVLLVMMSCTGKSTSSTISTISTTGTTGTSSSTTTTTSATSGKGTLNLTDDGPITLDPALVAEAGSGYYILQIFSGLTHINDKLQVVGDIAERWDVSPDGTTYTFHLRQDVKFQDGKQVTANDFKYSWERALNPATQSITASIYLDDIVGATDMLSGKASQLAGVKILDDYTLQVTIDAPKPYFLEKMAFPTAFVVEKSNVETGTSWWQKPVGTGPFKLQQWQQGQTLVLQRNDNYYGDKALLSQVVFQLLAGSPMQLYQLGTIDIAYVSADYLDTVTDPNNPLSKQLTIYPELSFYYLGFDTSTPPFDDVNVRQAFCYAVDKNKIVELATMNSVKAAYGILPPGMPGYNNNLTGLEYDPEKAKQLIKASKYSDLNNFPPVVLTTYGYGNYISGVLGGVIEQWRENLGIEVTVRQLEPEAFIYSLSQETNQIFDGSWIADYPDPQDFLDVLFHSDRQNNYGHYSNPQVDSILNQAATEQNPDTRLQMYQQAEQIIVQDAAALPLFFGQAYVLTEPYVKGYSLSPLGYPELNKVSIQK